MYVPIPWTDPYNRSLEPIPIITGRLGMYTSVTEVVFEAEAECTISQKRICNVSVGKYEEYVFYVSAIAYVILYVTV